MQGSVLSVRAVNDWNSHCVNFCTVNTLQNIFQLNRNRKVLNTSVLFEIGVIWHLSLCLLMPVVYFPPRWLRWNRWKCVCHLWKKSYLLSRARAKSGL